MELIVQLNPKREKKKRLKHKKKDESGEAAGRTGSDVHALGLFSRLFGSSCEIQRVRLNGG